MAKTAQRAGVDTTGIRLPRVREAADTMSVRLSPAFRRMLDHEGKKRGVGPSSLARMVLESWLIAGRIPMEEAPRAGI